MTTLAVLVTATVISVMTNSMITVLLPLIGQDFAASAAALGWTATAFLLSFGVAALFHGRLSDLFVVRGVFGVGLLLFGLGSSLAGLATCMPMLIIARVVQGLGGAAVPALSAVMVTRMLPAGRRGLAFGLIATGTGFAQAAGPALGGLIGQLAGWRALFMMTAFLTLPVLAGALWLLPGREHMVARTRFAPRALFANVPFAAACAVGFLNLFTYLAIEVLVPLLVTSVNRLDAAQTGLVLLPGAVAAVLISAPAGRWSDRLGPCSIIVTGLMVGVSVGFALVTVAVINAAAGTLPAEHYGVGLGIQQSVFYLGGGGGAVASAALLTARQDSPTAWNPLHTGSAVPFSDAFLAALAGLALALLVTQLLRCRVLPPGCGGHAVSAQTKPRGRFTVRGVL